MRHGKPRGDGITRLASRSFYHLLDAKELWHLFDDKRLSAAAEAFINEAATARRKIAISTISLAEVVYSIEKNRLPQSAYDELTQALADPEHVFTEAVFSAAIVQAMRQVSRAEVPDMPDRMVAASAVYFGVPVISRDRRIRAASLKTVW
jgi:PIN domain nuclease of toxin-antitoxin system